MHLVLVIFVRTLWRALDVHIMPEQTTYTTGEKKPPPPDVVVHHFEINYFYRSHRRRQTTYPLLSIISVISYYFVRTYPLDGRADATRGEKHKNETTKIYYTPSSCPNDDFGSRVSPGGLPVYPPPPPTPSPMLPRGDHPINSVIKIITGPRSTNIYSFVHTV